MIPSNKRIFQAPEGYFERLPEEIISKSKKKQRSIRITYWSGAAAAVILIGLALSIWIPQVPSDQKDLEVNLEPEIEKYINAGYWEAEDVLTLSENPDELLNEIIQAEWGQETDLDYEQDDVWF